jgi:hypothetical protein
MTGDSWSIRSLRSLGMTHEADPAFEAFLHEFSHHERRF